MNLLHIAERGIESTSEGYLNHPLIFQSIPDAACCYSLGNGRLVGEGGGAAFWGDPMVKVQGERGESETGSLHYQLFFAHACQHSCGGRRGNWRATLGWLTCFSQSLGQTFLPFQAPLFSCIQISHCLAVDLGLDVWAGLGSLTDQHCTLMVSHWSDERETRIRWTLRS